VEVELALQRYESALALAAIEAGRPAEALAAVRALITVVGDTGLAPNGRAHGAAAPIH
jgi:hypothetical protein